MGRTRDAVFSAARVRIPLSNDKELRAMGDYLSTGDVARRLGVTRQAVLQWAVHGRRTPCGQRLRLRTVRFGGRHAIRADWLANFLKATGEADPCVN